MRDDLRQLLIDGLGQEKAERVVARVEASEAAWLATPKETRDRLVALESKVLRGVATPEEWTEYEQLVSECRGLELDI